MPRRWVLVALLSSAVGCCLVAAASLIAPVTRPAEPAPPTAPPDRTAALAVLRVWDAARVDAWTQGDPAALRALYTAASLSGRADRRLLAAYDARGLRVHGLDVQRAEVAVVHRTDRRLVLAVTDRLAGGWVRTGTGKRVGLPHDRWTTRRVVMAQREGGWRVVEVRDRDGRGPTRSPR